MNAPTATCSLLSSCVLLILLVRHATPSRDAHAAAAARGTPFSAARLKQLHKLASDWEPELYAELGQSPPAKFLPGLRSSCVSASGKTRCVPGAYLLGNWQSNAKGLGILAGMHPNVSNVGNDRCWAYHNSDKGGRAWLRKEAPEGFEPKRQLLAALGCVTSLTFYPGFAGRFHKYWEQSYWPCKAACHAQRHGLRRRPPYPEFASSSQNQWLQLS